MLFKSLLRDVSYIGLFCRTASKYNLALEVEPVHNPQLIELKIRICQCRDQAISGFEGSIHPSQGSLYRRGGQVSISSCSAKIYMRRLVTVLMCYTHVNLRNGGEGKLRPQNYFATM